MCAHQQSSSCKGRSNERRQGPQGRDTAAARQPSREVQGQGNPGRAPGRTGTTNRVGTGRNGAGEPRPAASGAGRGTDRAERKPAPSGVTPDVSAGTAVPRWIQWTTFGLSLAGLGVSVYLTIAHFTTSVSLACPANSTINCEKVTTSPQSYVFGIPVAVLGLAFFVFMVAVTLPWAWQGTGLFTRLDLITGRARLGSVIVGIIFVLYLVYTEVITLNMTICLWCTAVHVITFIMFALIVYAATAGYGLTKSSAR
jgi:uncharacterized membrane protein